MSEFILSAVLWAVFLAFALLLILVAALFALLVLWGSVMIWEDVLGLLQESRAVDPKSSETRQ